MIKKNIFRYLYYSVQLGYKAALRIFLEKYNYRVSALAFTTLLSLVPLLSVIVSVVAFFPVFDTLVNIANDYIFSNFVPTSSSNIQLYLNNFIQQASKLPKLSVVFLIFTAIMMILTVEHTFNDIWGAPRRRFKWSTYIIYWTILFLSPIFIGLSVLISTYIFSLAWLVSAQKSLQILHFLSILPFIINTGIFAIIYTVIPNTKVRTKDALLGGFIVAVLFKVAKVGFAFFIKKFNSYELIYGALAAIPIFLIWIYIFWWIILYGAFIVHLRTIEHRARVSH